MISLSNLHRFVFFFQNRNRVCGYLLWSGKEFLFYLNNFKFQDANICQYMSTKQVTSCTMPAHCATPDIQRPGLRIAARSKYSKDNARSVSCIPRLYSNSASNCYVCVRSYCHWTTIHLKMTSGVIMTHAYIASHLRDTVWHRYWLHQMYSSA